MGMFGIAYLVLNSTRPHGPTTYNEPSLYKRSRCHVTTDTRKSFTCTTRFDSELLKVARQFCQGKKDDHVTAKTILVKREEQWLQLLPKVIKEVTRRE
nr:hypothetical protein [Tanacetum cinerariifolium]